MEDPYDNWSIPADPLNSHYDPNDLADLENLSPPEVDYYAVLNLSKAVSNPGMGNRPTRNRLYTKALGRMLTLTLTYPHRSGFR